MTGSSSTDRVTLVDVARRAGVSRSTASLVLRGSPLPAAETRERVLASMRELDYVYHRAAATLRTRRSRMVGLVIPDISNPFYAELTSGVEECLGESGNVVVLATSGDEGERQLRILSAMHENNADGVLLCPAEGTHADMLEAPAAWRLPVVLVVRYLQGVEADYVGSDNVRGAVVAVEHLIGHGHRRIAFIGGRPTSSARKDRLKGFRAAMLAHGLEVSERLLPTCIPTRAAGLAVMRDLLNCDQPPTAALCYNDVVAFGAMLALQQQGYAPGREVALIGFDDVSEAALWHPALTSVAIAPRTLGRQAARLLLERIERRDRPPRRVILSPDLAVRASCGDHLSGLRPQSVPR